MNLFSTEACSFDRTRRELFVEASTLGQTFRPGLDLQLKSHRTGDVRTFTYVGRTLDREQEVLSWEYQSACGLRAVVLND